MANEGLGKTDAIITKVGVTATYDADQTFALDAKGAQHLVLYTHIPTVGTATSIELRVRTRRASSGTYVERFAEKSFTIADGVRWRTVVANLDRDENEVEVAIKATGATDADATIYGRFSRQAVPLAT